MQEIYRLCLYLKETEDKPDLFTDEQGLVSRRLMTKRIISILILEISPYLDSNIPEGPVYDVNISRIVGFVRSCVYCDDFSLRHKMLSP